VGQYEIPLTIRERFVCIVPGAACLHSEHADHFQRHAPVGGNVLVIFNDKEPD